MRGGEWLSHGRCLQAEPVFDAPAKLLPHPLSSVPPTANAGPRRGRLLVCVVQYTLMVGLCITYSVTAGQSLKGIASEECDGADCQRVGTRQGSEGL